MRKMLMLLSVMILFSGFVVCQERSADNPIIYTGKKNPKPGSTSYLDYKCGFKDFIIGNNIDDYEDKLTDFNDISDDAYKFHLVVDGQMLTVNNIPIKRVLIGEFNGRVARILVQFENINGSDVYGVLKEAYGGGYKSNRFMDQFFWFGNEIQMSYDFEGLSDCNLIITSKTFDSAIKKAKKENNKNAVSDL